MISLSGSWEFRFDHERDWRQIPVPGCWEMLEGVVKNNPGPAWYRKRFDVPAEFRGKRIWLRFGGVSYHCSIRVNGKDVGEHTGLWGAFSVEITDAVRPGQEAELLLKVEKPASLNGGPSSRPLPGNFPLKKTLSGFLPYVWGHIFGGIWQDVSLYSTGPVAIQDIFICGSAEGMVRAEVTLDGTVYVDMEVKDAGGSVVASVRGRGREVKLDTRIENAHPWSPYDPTLYTARIVAGDSDERTIRFGLRTQTIGPDGTTIQLNSQPILPRMVLSWGWYPDSLNSNPGPDRVRADFKRLKSLGYNGVKLCLWFPPQYYFDLADEMGMLLWVELPMWLPEPNDFFKKQTPIEYERLVKLARNHPSVILYTLGCELNRSIGAEILQPLFTQAKQLTEGTGVLIRDNSGGGDAYGGLLNEFAEFYDYHFYSDLQFFRPLLDEYAPRGRPNQPWVFGEFCDLDTYRDLRHVYIANGDKKPWWTVRDDQLNPQGARWQFDIVDWEARLKSNGYWDRGDELVKLSNRYALIHRKFTLETVRLYREIGGYVVTGEADTPISTAGMWDDLDQLKFDAAEFCAFNADLVLLLAWDRRRAWINGGDRVANWDHFCYRAGSTVRPHLVASHFGRATGKAQATWSCDDVEAAGSLETSDEIGPGSLREIGVAEFKVPKLDHPRRAVFRASVEIGNEKTQNSWPIWFFPADVWKDVENIALIDPLGRLSDLPAIAKKIRTGGINGAAVVIATVWTDELRKHVSGGGRAILLQTGRSERGPIPVVEMPFWREAIRLIESKHPAWGDFPIDDGVTGMQFFGCATDCALDTAKLDRPQHPILRRLDARTMALHDYATEIEWDKGRLIVSTLRFEGSFGLANSSQPLGLSRNVAAAHLLFVWVRYLQSQ